MKNTQNCSFIGIRVHGLYVQIFVSTESHQLIRSPDISIQLFVVKRFRDLTMIDEIVFEFDIHVKRPSEILWNGISETACYLIPTNIIIAGYMSKFIGFQGRQHNSNYELE